MKKILIFIPILAMLLYLSSCGKNNQMELEDFVKAISHFTKAYELGGSTVENAYYLAMSYLAINDKTTAQQYIDEVNDKYGNSTYATQLNAYVASLK